MARILVTRPFPGPALSRLEASGHEVVVNRDDRPLDRAELLRFARGCAGLLTQLHDEVDQGLLDAAGSSLRVVSQFAVGFNNVDVAAATARGVVVCNTPGVLTEATADLAWTLLLAAARRVVEGDRMVRTSGFDGWGPSMLLGADIVGKTLLVVGAGRIGYAVARRALAWRMSILYVSRSAKAAWASELSARRVSLDKGLGEADFVSLHVPLTDETRHLIGAPQLLRMKPTAYLINTARGPVVDEEALVQALEQGTIAGAGLDVFEREPLLAEGLAARANAVLLPHLGSATIDTRGKMGDLAVDNLLAVLGGEDPPHPVNPQVLPLAGPVGTDNADEPGPGHRASTDGTGTKGCDAGWTK